jgi:hypothetical protein
MRLAHLPYRAPGAGVWPQGWPSRCHDHVSRAGSLRQSHRHAPGGSSPPAGARSGSQGRVTGPRGVGVASVPGDVRALGVRLRFRREAQTHRCL